MSVVSNLVATPLGTEKIGRYICVDSFSAAGLSDESPRCFVFRNRHTVKQISSILLSNVRIATYNKVYDKLTLRKSSNEALNRPPSTFQPTE